MTTAPTYIHTYIHIWYNARTSGSEDIYILHFKAYIYIHTLYIHTVQCTSTWKLSYTHTLIRKYICSKFWIIGNAKSAYIHTYMQRITKRLQYIRMYIIIRLAHTVPLSHMLRRKMSCRAVFTCPRSCRSPLSTKLWVTLHCGRSLHT